MRPRPPSSTRSCARTTARPSRETRPLTSTRPAASHCLRLRPEESGKSARSRSWRVIGAALGGLDTLVFAGGIGENASVVRERICAGLEFFGVQLDRTRNNTNAPVISTVGSEVTVRVIRTNEELMIAKAVCHELGLTTL